MIWGNRALPLAALVLSLSALTGCGAVDDYAGWHRAPGPDGYRPMTESTFAGAMTQAMFEYETTHFEMTILDESMSMDVRFGASDDLAMTGTYDDGKSVATMLVVDGEVYVRDGRDDTYFQFPDQLADQMLAQMEVSNPTAMADDFRSGIDTVAYGGANEVAYGPAHRYEVTMSKEFLADELDLPIEAVPDFNYRMWFDDDNLLRRFQVVFDDGIAADVTFSDWGVPVDVEPPPSGQVEPLPMPTDET